jgi:cellulose synthase (UDP-forming)
MIAVGWLLEIPLINQLFYQLHLAQTSPPTWIEVPNFEQSFLIYLPLIIFVSLTWVITKASPTPQPWSRTAIILLSMGLTFRYLLWRSLSSLNLSNPIEGIVSLAVFGAEGILLSSVLLQSFLDLNFKERYQEADSYSQDVTSGKYQPTVDIFIPTYNEPEFILKRTIIVCQSIHYPHKQIYLLDDTRRPEIKQLAEILGCHYLTRPDNLYAKAGNLNHAMTQTQGELITVFDADFVPTHNFLMRTIGFFQNSKIGLLQTCQAYFNEDAIAYNLGLEKELNGEEDFFHRYGQPVRDGLGAGFCSGSSFIIRRKTLEDVGGFNTECLAEDYYTGLVITSKGYKVIHLNEPLSVGLYTESIPDHLRQKSRWGQGTLQTLFVKVNFFQLPNLTLKQRLACLNSLLYWVIPIFQSIIFIIPLLYTFWDIRPVMISLEEMIYLFLPYYFIHLMAFHWLNEGSRTITMSEIYNYLRFFPMLIMILKTLINPFGEGFKITPKGVLKQKGHFYWKLALPLMILWLMNGLSLVKSMETFRLVEDNNIVNLGLIWSLYNLLILSVTIMTLKEKPKPDPFPWFSINEKIQIGQQLIGITEKISEQAIIINLPLSPEITSLTLNQRISLDLVNQHLTLTGKIKNLKNTAERVQITLSFVSVTLEQYRQLVYFLFSSRLKWKPKIVPNELVTVGLFLKVLISPILALTNGKKQL